MPILVKLVSGIQEQSGLTDYAYTLRKITVYLFALLVHNNEITAFMTTFKAQLFHFQICMMLLTFREASHSL